MSRVVSRRAVLRGAAGSATALFCYPQAKADQTVLEKRRPTELKISCSSLAFSDMSWEAALEEIKQLGFQYVDLAMIEGWAHVSPSQLSDPEGHAKRITTVCGRLELEPIAIHANFAIGDAKQFPGLTISDPAARKTILAQFERVVACARAAAIPLVNVQPGKFIENVSRENCIKNATDMLIQMHASAARRDLWLSIENHTGSIAQDPGDAAKILDTVTGLRLDYGLSHVVSNQYSLEQTMPLMKHVAHVGVRNAKPKNYDAPIENGELDFAIRPFLEAFRKEKVSAFVSIEYFGPARRTSILPLKLILEREKLPIR